MPAPSWRVATVAACLVAVAVVAFAWTFGARCGSGSDSLGYVSQAYLWLDGEDQIDTVLAARAPWPYAAESLSPLSYRPRGTRAAVPICSPGVPLVMATFVRILGGCGPFLVAPLFGALLVGATFLLAARLTRHAGIALFACVLMATSPAFLVNVILPMSDTVAAALWTLSLCALTWPGVRPACLAGIAGAVAVLVRPNLAPLAVAAALAAETWRGESEARARRAVAYLAVVGGAVIFVAWLNNRLYGSPLLSGYGPAGDLYSPAHLARNLRQFRGWLLQSEWPALLLLVPAAFRRYRPQVHWSTVTPVAFFAGLVLASYLFYQPFDAWWYLRFLLPAYPLMFIAVALVGSRLVLGAAPRLAMTSLATAAIVLGAARIVPHAGEIFTIGPGEDRYRAVAEFIVRGLPPRAAFISMQHSGTIRFYAGRVTVRYDWLTPGRLVSAIEWLRDEGYRPYIVLENWEEPRFRQKFQDAGRIGRLQLRTIAEVNGVVGVRIYDPLEGVDTPGPAPGVFAIDVRRGSCAAPAPHWRVPYLEFR